jgi:hypothetical protein
MRPEFAGALTPEPDGGYVHFLGGPCRCGTTHSPGVNDQRRSGNGFGAPPRGSETKQSSSDDDPPKRLVRERRWEIRDTANVLHAVHRRKDFDDGSKELWWEGPDGRPGLGGRAVKDLPPYRAHLSQPGRPTIHVEGEQAADALAPLAESLNINVLGHVTGAPVTHSADAFRPVVSPRHYLWPDNDEAGETQMARTHEVLREVLRDEQGIPLTQSKDAVRRIAWEDAPEKGDAADWVAQGGTVEDLSGLLAEAPPVHSAGTPRPGAAQSTFRFHSAREIAAATTEVAAFAAEPWLPEGGLLEIDGKIKSSGKTTFATHMCRAILDGRDFLGKPTRHSSVVYLSEQSPATFREALRRADLLDRDDFRVLFWRDTIGARWSDVVRAARDEAKRFGAKLLVVDTLPQFAGVRGDAENNAGAALEAVAPLQEVAAVDGLAVIILRHERKGGGDVGDSGRGSSAFAGAVDVVLRLRRSEGAARPGIRVLDALSRFDQTPDTLVIELTDAGFVALGDTEAVAAEEARAAVLEAAPRSEEDAIREADLLLAAEVKRTVGQGAIREYLDAGRLCRTGEGKKGDPFRYWKPGDGEKGSAASKGEAPAESNSVGDPERDQTTEYVSAAAQGPAAERNGHDPETKEKGSAGTSSLSAAERNMNEVVDLLAAIVTECRRCGGSVESGLSYCFACDPRGE